MPEPEIMPDVPTSGQLLGAIAKTLGVKFDDNLSRKTATRYFSGRQDRLVRDDNKEEIIAAIAKGIREMGLFPGKDAADDAGLLRSITEALLHHAAEWDGFRSFLLPRVSFVEPAHLPAVWGAYARLATIDLALRTAAYWHFTNPPPSEPMEFDWTLLTEPGKYLNQKRTDAGITLEKLAEATGVSRNAVDAWMYQNVRPSNSNIEKIAETIAYQSDSPTPNDVTARLKIFYWFSDIANLLGKHLGADQLPEIIQKLQDYSILTYLFIKSLPDKMADRELLADLLWLGSESAFAKSFLPLLSDREPDAEWREDLKWAGINRGYRVLLVNRQVHNKEIDALNQARDGALFQEWGISNPQAHEHYMRGLELQNQGKIWESMAEVDKAIQLDPLDWANHITQGSGKGYMGVILGNETMIKDALAECWLAANLAPTEVLPWAEIGWILTQTGRHQEAVEHLKSISDQRHPMHVRYYRALGVAQRGLGHFQDALKSLEQAFHIDREDTDVVTSILITVSLLGNKNKFRRYSKIARHLGIPDEMIAKSKRVTDAVHSGEIDAHSYWASLAQDHRPGRPPYPAGGK